MIPLTWDGSEGDGGEQKLLRSMVLGWAGLRVTC